jgi:hypothetical protein
MSAHKPGDTAQLIRLDRYRDKAASHSQTGALKPEKARQGLTAKQEAFARAIARGAKQVDAYREAYPARGNRKPDTEWQNATRLMGDPKVAARIHQLLAMQEVDLSHDMAAMRRKALKILDDIMTNGQRESARVTAARLILDLAGIKAFDTVQEQAKPQNAADLEKAIRDKLTRLLGQPVDIPAQSNNDALPQPEVIEVHEPDSGVS